MKHFANLNFRSVLLVVFSLLLFSISEKTKAQTLIAGWDFQTSPGTAVLASPNTPKLYNANVGSGTFYLDGTNNSSTWASSELDGFGGSALNAGGSTGLSTVATGASCLALVNSTANSKIAVFKVNMSGYKDLIISYATRNTSTGFSTQLWEYSINGTNWNSIGTITGLTTTFATKTLPSISGLNGVATAYVRLTVTGATNASGNNRLDNIQFNATLIPVPTLTISSTSLTNLSYVESNGPSAEKSYTLSGSVLNPASDTIKILAPANFEISKTSGSGFKDSLNVLYSGSAFASTTIYARLKAGLVANTYADTIRHSGGGIASPLKVNVSGSVTSVPPPVVTTTGTLTSFSTFVGNPVTSQSYTVSGTNLVSDITITAPSGFEIKTGANPYASSLVLPQSSGSVASTIIDVRLINTSAGTFSGNITHATTNLSPSATVAVSGTVATACATPTNISVVRASIPEQGTYAGTAPNSPATVSGRVTAIFGPNKFYVQDATGGLAIFSSANSGVVIANGIALGDSVRVTGPTARFNGEAEFNGVTCVNKVTGSGAITTPPAVIFDANNPPSGVNLPTFLANNEGKLVKIISSNIGITGNFASGSNYAITACNSQGEAEIRVDATATTIANQAIPTVTQDITGVIGHYINASATVNILQLFPRTISDFSNSAITCVTPVASQSASCGPITFSSVPVDSTLDVTCWNVEWLGNTTTSPSALGPTNDGQQMTNVMSVLKNTKSDIFCIEEVCDYKKFVDSVKTNLPKYKVRCQTKYYSHFFDSPETTSATTFGQKVCFVYDSTVVSMVDTVSLLASQYGYNATPVATPYPNNWASGRLPFMFIGNVNIGGKTKQVHFVGLHAKSGSDATSYNRRKQDVIDLKAKLDTDYPTANIIMLGDYNDDLDSSIYVGNPSTYKNFVIDAANYTQITKSLSDCAVSSTAKYPDIIDHIMISNEIGVIPASGPNPAASASDIYYLEKTVNVSRPINYVAGYTTTTSDHYPVNARFSFGFPTLPPATITSITTGNWSSASTWDCNCVPTAASDVIIDTAHTVTVDVASQAKSLNLKGTLNYISTFILSLGM